MCQCVTFGANLPWALAKALVPVMDVIMTHKEVCVLIPEYVLGYVANGGFRLQIVSILLIS